MFAKPEAIRKVQGFVQKSLGKKLNKNPHICSLKQLKKGR